MFFKTYLQQFSASIMDLVSLFINDSLSHNPKIINKKRMHDKKILPYAQAIFSRIEIPYSKVKEESQSFRDDGQKKEEVLEVNEFNLIEEKNIYFFNIRRLRRLIMRQSI